MDIVRRVVSKILHLYYEFRVKNMPIKGKVLMFHNIGGEKGEFYITVVQFKNILERLKRKNVVRLEEWEEKRDFLCLTIDDVPESFYINAYPLLKKYQLPFTIFVSCSLLDTVGYITTEMLKEMAECELCTVGSHGWNHDFFYKLSELEARKDLESSRKHLETLINRPVELFAFPYGSYYACGLRYKHLAKEFYKYGFGTVASSITEPSLLPMYFLPRMNVSEENINKL